MDNEKPSVEGVEPARPYGSTAEEEDNPPYHGMSVGTYLRTRFSSLKPPMKDAPNPFLLLGMLTGRQWAFFMVAFVAWVSRQQIPRNFSVESI
jgi:MFS transporter, SHS family, lactate transporter